PGPRLTGTESREPSVRPERRVTKWTTTAEAPWNLALFLRVATGSAARSNVPTPSPRPPTDIVSAGSGVGDGVGMGVAVARGVGVVGVGVGAPEQADRSTRVTP